MDVRATDVADLTAGTAMLGSGGGGSPAVARHLVDRALHDAAAVPLVDARDLPPDAWLGSVGAVGSSTVMLERLPSGQEFVRAVRALERHLGHRLTALQPLEIGGLNGLLGVATAAWLGLPLVDADAMGRAFPRIDQTTLAGVADGVAALAEPGGSAAVLDCPRPSDLERVVRAALPAFGAWSAIAIYPARADVYARASVLGSVSRALALGARLRAAAAAPPAERRDLVTAPDVTVLGEGSVLEISRTRHATGAGGVVTVERADDPRRTLRVEFADEYIAVLDDGEVVAAVPDVVCVLDTRDWQPVMVERLATRQPVIVLRVSAPPEWRRPGRRELTGPAAYGLALPEAPPEPAKARRCSV